MKSLAMASSTNHEALATIIMEQLADNNVISAEDSQMGENVNAIVSQEVTRPALNQLTNEMEQVLTTGEIISRTLMI